MSVSRRDFVKTAVSSLPFTVALGRATRGHAQVSSWRDRIGIELWTVRDLQMKSFEQTLERVAAVGFREIEPSHEGSNKMPPSAVRPLLEKYRLAMPSTHETAIGTGAALDRTLEGFQSLGVKYISIAATPPTGNTGVVPPQSTESAKRMAARLNADGRIVQKFGMKTYFHNHTEEFGPVTDGTASLYDIILAETDPSLVAMQLDIGWAAIAGQDVIAMFKRHPGRYELWHVKDAIGIRRMDPALTHLQRRYAATLVPVGLGEVDYKPIFAEAQLAGLKHFVIEQDNAGAWGDSLAAARVSYENVAKLLA
jgi:sugar phosphate isomerase/epimerase